MTPEEIRIAIAGACGWEDIHPIPFLTGLPRYNGQLADESELVPDYLTDLNAVHEAEKMLDDEQWLDYRAHLSDIVRGMSAEMLPS